MLALGVRVQHRLADYLFAANHTFERPFSGVVPEMNLQSLRLLERFRANLALVGAVLLMKALMSAEVNLSGKRFAASAANKVLRVLVQYHVNFQRLHGIERLSAHVAHAPQLLVHQVLVVSDRALGRANLVAFGTFEFRPLVVLVVSAQVLLVVRLY